MRGGPALFITKLMMTYAALVYVTLAVKVAGRLSAKVTKNANLGYSHDRGLSYFQGWGFL